MVKNNNSSFANSINQEKSIHSFLTGKNSNNKAATPTSPQSSIYVHHSSKLSFPIIKFRSFKKKNGNASALKLVGSLSMFANPDSNTHNSTHLEALNETNLKITRYENQYSESFGSRTHIKTSRRENENNSLSNVLTDNSNESIEKPFYSNENKTKKPRKKNKETNYGNNGSSKSYYQIKGNYSAPGVEHKQDENKKTLSNRNIESNTTESRKTCNKRTVFSKKEEPSFYSSNRSNKKRLNEAKCTLCEEAVMEKRASEKILDLKCGHVAHDSCIFLFMVMNQDNMFKSGNILFPSCEACENKDIQCIPEDNNLRDELISKYLLHKEDKNAIEEIESPAINTSLKSPLQNTFSVMDFGSNNRDIFSDRPSLDSAQRLDKESNKRSFNNTSELNYSSTMLNNNSDDFSSVQLPTSPPSVGLLPKQSFSSKSVIRKSTLGQSSSTQVQFHNNTQMTNLKLSHQATLSRDSSLSRKAVTRKFPKPIVKRLQNSLPSSTIFSSVNSSFKKPENFFDDEDDEEVMIIQIDTSLNSKNEHRYTSRKSFNVNNLSITSEHLIRLVSQRLKIVQELIARHPDYLQKNNIDSDLGLLRLVDTFQVAKGLEKTQNYVFCKCYLFEKMLLLEYDKDVFQKIKIRAEEVSLDLINSELFRVSFLSAEDINIFYFKSSNNNDQKVKKWISALSDFDMEFQEEILETLDKNITNQTILADLIMGSNDMIIKRGDFQITNLMPIKNNLKPKNLIVVLQLDTSKLLKKSENCNLVNSIKTLQHYFDIRKGVLRFVVLDETSKILTIGTASDILMQLNCCLHDQIRGKKLNKNLWYSLVYKKYYSALKTNIDVIIISNSEMIEVDNCLFNNFYGSEENILKIHIGYLNIDYCESIIDLVEINTLMELMEIICFSFDFEFGQDETDSTNHSPISQEKNNTSYETFRSLATIDPVLNVKQQEYNKNVDSNRSSKYSFYPGEINEDDSLELDFLKKKRVVLSPMNSYPSITAIKNENILYNYL